MSCFWGSLLKPKCRRLRSEAIASLLIVSMLVLPTVGTRAARVTRVHRNVSASRLCRGVSRVRPTRPNLHNIHTTFVNNNIVSWAARVAV